MEKFLYKGGIYKILFPSGRVYIGQSVELRERINCYKRLDCKGQIKLYNAIKKYGFENTKIEILVYTSDKDDLNWWEKYYIEKFNSTNRKYGYNLRTGGEGWRHHQSTKDKISKAGIGRKSSENTKAKQRKYMLGKPMKTTKTTSKYVGVYWNRNIKKWTASIVLYGKTTNLGSYQDEAYAAKVYDIKRRSFIGETLSQDEMKILDNLPKKKILISGKQGVLWCKSKQKWKVIYHGKSFGVFDKMEEAIKVAELKDRHEHNDILTPDELELIKPKVLQNYSGHKGVYFSKRQNTWRVNILYQSYGYFKTKEEAIMKAKEVYEKIKKEKLNGSPTLN